VNIHENLPVKQKTTAAAAAAGAATVDVVGRKYMKEYKEEYRPPSPPASRACLRRR